MPSTTNFGWTTPADTDYVKDGASAIRTLAGGIDTSMAQLKGGTTGQILSKTNGTDMAFTWINNDQGDITGVTAGTGLSGGGTSGAVTLSIDTATTVDKTTAQTLTNKTISATSNTLTGVINNTLTTTTGDLIYASSANTPTRLGIGSSNQVLTVSGGVPTWATPSGSSGPAFSAYNTSSQSISQDTWTKVNLGTEDFDTASNFASNRFTPTTAGYYQINANAYMGGTGMAKISIYKNGSIWNQVENQSPSTFAETGLSLTALVYLNGSTDYVELYAYSGASSPTVSGSSGRPTMMSGVWIRS